MDYWLTNWLTDTSDMYYWRWAAVEEPRGGRGRRGSFCFSTTHWWWWWCFCFCFCCCCAVYFPVRVGLVCLRGYCAVCLCMLGCSTAIFIVTALFLLFLYMLDHCAVLFLIFYAGFNIGSLRSLLVYIFVYFFVQNHWSLTFTVQSCILDPCSVSFSHLLQSFLLSHWAFFSNLLLHSLFRITA